MRKKHTKTQLINEIIKIAPHYGGQKVGMLYVKTLKDLKAFLKKVKQEKKE